MPEKKDSSQPAVHAGSPGPGPELPSQRSIDLLTRLLQEFERRSGKGSNVPPEIERDVAVVTAAFNAIQSALGLDDSPIRISRVTPNNGPAAGGTRVTLAGSNFLTGTSVRFGTGEAKDVSIVSMTELQATTPGGSPGPVEVVVNTLAGSAVLARGFTYESATGVYS